MSFGFLGHARRAELARKPERAIHCWQNGFDTGQCLCDQKRWREALPYLGTAFETSEIMMTTNAVKPQCAHELFNASAALLIDGYAGIGAKAQCEEIYRMAAVRLRRESCCYPEARARIKQYISQLHKHVQRSAAKGRQHVCSRAVLSA